MNSTTRVSLVHLGCARNLIDSEVILGRMAEEGLCIAGRTEDADIAVLNTCSFIGPAREESESVLKDLLRRKSRGALRGVVVAGCLVQRFKRELQTRFPAVDLFAEISDYKELARAVAALSEGRSGPSYLEGPGLRPAEREGARLLSTPSSYAYLRISHGCDHTCSFCAIPAIRGTHRSKPLDDVVDEARELLGNGVRELVLVAEDATAWGRDLGRELPDLVEALGDVAAEAPDGGARIRVMYAYPNRFPWKLTSLLREHPSVLPYLDIPVQHIATPVLRAMRRAGDGDQVRRILDRLRDEVPGLTLRTTLLVGFPGETDADVQELVEFVRAYGIGRLGVFCYSHEEGTHGATLGGCVPAEVAEERRAEVLAARDEVLLRAQSEQVGRTLDVLVDEVHATRLVGRTEMDAPEVDLVAVAPFSGAAPSVGQRVRFLVEEVGEEGDLFGRLAAEVAASAAERSGTGG